MIPSGDLRKIPNPSVRIFVGPAWGSATQDITLKVPLDSLVIEETGTLDEAVCSFSIIDRELLYAAIRGEWKVHIIHVGETVYKGFISRPRAEISAIYGEQAVSCRDVSSLLDRLIVKSKFIRTRVESDTARIQWIVNTIGQPLVREGMTNWGATQTLNAALPHQNFPPRLTLRQCIERILAASSPSANYYVDYWPTLHTYDRDNPESGHVAPYNINATASPGGGEITGEDLKVDWDTDGLVNSYYVQGRNSLGSGHYTDIDLLPGPSSVHMFGLRSAYIQAPDADTATKARTIARLALNDTRNPVPRGSFKVYLPYLDERFKGGQLIYITSAIHGLNGAGADPGPWAGPGADGYQIQPLRIVSVTTRYLNGKGDRIQEVEFGGRAVHRYQASIPA